MVHGFISLVKSKLARFPESLIMPAIFGQDVVENHFSQFRGANGQNDNPTYQISRALKTALYLGKRQ